jgi:hypothetical protein
MNEEQLNDQQKDAQGEQDEGPFVMMMFTVPMVEGIGADTEGQEYHSSLKYEVMDDVYTKQRQMTTGIAVTRHNE